MLSKDRIAEHVRTTLRAIFEKGVATAAEVKLSPVEAGRLEAAELIKRAGSRQTGRKGRPAIEWRLTDKARKRVKRVLTA